MLIACARSLPSTSPGANQSKDGVVRSECRDARRDASTTTRPTEWGISRHESTAAAPNARELAALNSAPHSRARYTEGPASLFDRHQILSHSAIVAPIVSSSQCLKPRCPNTALRTIGIGIVPPQRLPSRAV